jgi:Bacterial Ig-like domain (group 1)
MRYVLLPLILSLVVDGCAGSSSSGTRTTSIAAPGATGAPGDLIVQVYNGAQNPILVSVQATVSGTASSSVTIPASGAVIIPLGGVGDFDLGPAPQSFTVNANMDSTIAFSFTPQTFTLGQNYSATTTAVPVNYYQSQLGSPTNSGVTQPTGPTAGPPASIVASSGNNQTATAGTALPSPLVVLVTDANSVPVPNASVSFTVTSGAGVLSVQTATTNAQGAAQTNLTLDPTPGINTVSATTSSLPTPAIFTETGL